MRGKPKIKYITLPLYAVFIIAALISAVLVYYVFLLQFYDMSELYYGLENAGYTIFFLNFLPVFLCMLLFIFITGRISLAFLPVSVFLTLLGLTNRTKIILRNDPVMPTDFTVGAEAFTIAGTMRGDTTVKYAALVVGAAVIGIFFIIFIRNRPLGSIVRLIGTGLTGYLIFISFTTLYANEELYDRLPVMEEFYLVSHFNTKGLIYCYIYQINATGLLSRRIPNGYNRDDAIRIIENSYTPVKYTADKAPHIFIIMGESFSDISNKSNIDFSGYRDPLENFNRLKEQGVYGEVIVPHIGGGTADTEFELLTGFSKREEEGASYAFRLLSRKTESIAANLNAIGYKSIFIHPGFDWFYNRVNVYSLMGFDALYFSDYFINKTYKGGYISEYDTIDACIKLFEEADSPVFLFCVTIQNHGPYKDKYGGFKKNFDGSGLSDLEINELSNYFYGTIDQDENLGRLADYLNTLTDPALLLYFGDHIPPLSLDLLKKIGIAFDYDEGFATTTELFKTPYLFWQNDAARADTNISQGDKGIIGSNFLGAMVLDFAGFGHISSISRFLNETREDISVTVKTQYITKDGFKTFEDLTNEELEKMLLYKYWQYYKLYDE